MTRTRSTDEYLNRLRSLPALARCSHRQLVELAKLVDAIDLPAGAALSSSGTREVLVTMTPTRVLIIDRRVLAAVSELAPELAASA